MQKRKSFEHCEYNRLSAENVRDRRAQPLTELSLSERSEDSAANRALRARIGRKLEAYKQEATQLPRLNCLGRRESVLSTYGISWVKGSPGYQTGGRGHGQSGAPCRAGGECFAQCFRWSLPKYYEKCMFVNQSWMFKLMSVSH